MSGSSPTPQYGPAKAAAAAALESLRALCGVLGLLTKERDDLPEEIRALAEERAQARKEKNWARSDELRDAIRAAGYILEDTKQGQKIRKDNEK